MKKATKTDKAKTRTEMKTSAPWYPLFEAKERVAVVVPQAWLFGHPGKPGEVRRVLGGEYLAEDRGRWNHLYEVALDDGGRSLVYSRGMRQVA